MVALLFPNSLGAIGWSFLPYIEKFKNISIIALVIHENLMKKHKKIFTKIPSEHLDVSYNCS